MVDDKNRLCLEVLLSLDDVFGVHFAVNEDLGPHVVNHEWLGEVKLVVGVWHGLEVHGHSGSRLNISDLVVTHSGVHVGVKELDNGSSVFWEVWVFKTLLPLLIVIDDVESLWSEVLLDLLVGKNGVEEPNLINGWFHTLVSNTGVDSSHGGEEVNFPNKSLGEHHEGSTAPEEEATGPSIVGTVKAGSNLVKIIRSTVAPFKIIVSVQVA